jgi:peptidoglycan/LPS O-acetylase OafA/YrhL
MKSLESQVSNPEVSKVGEYAAFDILRFVLATSVFLYHMGVLHWHQSGNLAVQVFFALSGWLIGGILLQTRKSELGRFFYNRSTRIWIPYFFSIFALYLTSFAHEKTLSSRWGEFLVYDLTFTHNWFSLKPNAELALSQMPLHGTGNHLWSLAVEEQFYLAAPLFITVFKCGKNVLPWLIISGIAVLSESQYASISLGVLAAVIYFKYGDFHLSPLGRSAIALFFILSSALLYFNDKVYNFISPLFAVCTVLMCAYPLGRTRLTKTLGGISFPLYLNAWIGTFAFHYVDKRFLQLPYSYGLLFEFISGLTVAIILYFLLDLRVMQIRDKVYRKSLGVGLGMVSYSLVAAGVIYASVKNTLY